MKHLLCFGSAEKKMPFYRPLYTTSSYCYLLMLGSSMRAPEPVREWILVQFSVVLRLPLRICNNRSSNKTIPRDMVEAPLMINAALNCRQPYSNKLLIPVDY